MRPVKKWERLKAKSEEWNALAVGLLFGAGCVGVSARWGHAVVGLIGLAAVVWSWRLNRAHWRDYREECERDVRFEERSRQWREEDRNMRR